MPQLIQQILVSGPLLLVLFALAAVCPRVGSRTFQGWERSLGRQARKPARAALLVGLLSLLVNSSLCLYHGLPVPRVPDEFGFLLSADTFIHGRLTNPTPVVWPFLETLCVLFRPSYSAAYMPGQGLVLAFGQLLFNKPIGGVWLCSCLTVISLTWMLYQWLPERWAFIGGLIAALHPTMADWSQSYWGGSLSAIGGALVLGGVKALYDDTRLRAPRRTRKRLDAGPAIGIGLAILTISRPFEGWLFAAGCGLALLLVARQARGAEAAKLWRNSAPMWLFLLPAVAWIVYFNWRVTGNLIRSPSSQLQAQYSATPTFLWEPAPHAPLYSADTIRGYYLGQNSAPYRQSRTPSGLLKLLAKRAITLLLGFYRPLALTLTLAMIPWLMRRDLWARAAAIPTALLLFGLLTEKRMVLSYAAPGLALALLALVSGLRALHGWRWRGRPSGRLLARGLVLVLLLAVGNSYLRLAKPHPRMWSARRARLSAALKHATGRYLVIVRYGSAHRPEEEWIYNDADVAGAKVVWARDRGAALNRLLLDVFRDRRVLLVEPDVGAVRVGPYPSGLPLNGDS